MRNKRESFADKRVTFMNKCETFAISHVIFTKKIFFLHMKMSSMGFRIKQTIL